MKTRALIIIIVFLAWSVGSIRWYLCKIKGLCFAEEKEIVAANIPEKKEAKGNLTFSNSVATPEINEFSIRTFDSLKSLTIDTLVITGFYLSGEKEEIALNRANNVKNLLLENGFDNHIKLSSSFNNTPANGKFSAIKFLSITNKKGLSNATGDFKVERKQDKLIIYFPVASADPHTNKQLSKELKTFAESIADGKEQISITGHTDNSGTHEINLKYGKLRADAIKNLLVEYGVPSKKLLSYSKGESEPIAENSTKAGKKKNRRVEIRVLTDQ